jgi:hypothetical protein
LRRGGTLAREQNIIFAEVVSDIAKMIPISSSDLDARRRLADETSLFITDYDVKHELASIRFVKNNYART